MKADSVEDLRIAYSEFILKDRCPYLGMCQGVVAY